MFAELWLAQFTPVQILELFVRIVVSGCCGAAIGSERTKRLKSAGIRTHVLVCCAAALWMIISKYAFADMALGDLGSRGADSARIAAQAVSGISFLCAGVIFKNENHVSGLTTAASLWCTTAVGLSLGAGMYVVGIPSAVLLVIFQMVMHRFTFGKDSLSIETVTLRVKEPFDFSAAMDPLCQAVRAKCKENSIRLEQDGTTVYQFVLQSREPVTAQQWKELMEGGQWEILSVECSHS